MTAGIKTLEIMDKPGVYDYLDKITGKLINGILDAGRAAGHDVCGGHINGEQFLQTIKTGFMPLAMLSHKAKRCIVCNSTYIWKCLDTTRRL